MPSSGIRIAYKQGMELKQLKALIKDKSAEFEEAIQAKKPHTELLQIYKEIKKIAYQITLKENEVALMAN
jgi:hypothetical protein